jgi:G3E family GTPase
VRLYFSIIRRATLRPISLSCRTGGGDPNTKLAEVLHWLPSAKQDHSHRDEKHLGDGDHIHLDDNHSVDIQSFSLRVEEEIDWTAFGIWLTLLLHRHGAKILRVKGLLRVSDAAGPIVLHAVQHVIHPPILSNGLTTITPLELCLSCRALILRSCLDP